MLFRSATALTPAVIRYNANSADFAGLQTLEEKISTLRPPPWPRDIFPIDDQLAARGKPLFDANCGACHGERDSRQPGHPAGAWDTPVKAVGTDPKMLLNAGREGDPGIYAGALLPPPTVGVRFAKPAKIGDVLASSVVGSQLDEAFLPLVTPDKIRESGVWRALRMDLADLAPGKSPDDLLRLDASLLKDLNASLKTRLGDMYRKPAASDAGAAYESRVLRGIWATAPYLHNGSVPNLWELLTPAKDRKPSFMVGSRLFDPKNVGYATDQSPFKSGTFVTDPANANGNGNGGHEYGTTLTPDERWAIIEYLKTL